MSDRPAGLPESPEPPVPGETLVNHPPDTAPPAGNRPLVAPIYQSVKFEFDTIADTQRALRGERPGYFYSRSANPTVRQLERTLAQLQGREACLTAASGVNVIAQTLLALVQQGDHVLGFVDTYGPTRHLLRTTLARFGVRHTLLSIEDLAGIERVLAAEPTRLVVFESPTNPMNKVADITAICALARRHGALTVLDNTLAGPHQHGQFPIDLFVHSLTKCVNGHSDVLAGALIGAEALIARLRREFQILGGMIDPHAAYLLQRGLKTYFIRYREQSARAQHIAEFLAQHPAVARVHYPGLTADRYHALARAQMSEAGCVVTLDLRAGQAAAARRFADALRLFAVAASFGSTESLVLPAEFFSQGDLSAEERSLTGIGAGTVRLSIGLEDTQDLVQDLDQALGAADAA